MREAGPRDPWLVLALDVGMRLQPAGRPGGLAGLSQQGVVCKPRAGRLPCRCAELRLSS